MAFTAQASPIRVVQVVQYFQVGGIERMVQTLALGARAHGVHTTVLAYVRDGLFRPVLEGQGIPTGFIPSGPGRDLGLPLRLAAAFRRLNAQVVHAHHLGPFLYSAPAAKLVGAAHLQTEHSVEFYNEPRRRLVGALMPRLSRVVCVSPAVAEWREQALGTRPEVVQNGVPVPPPVTAEARQAARARLELPSDARVVGCVARLSAEKDHATLLRAMERLPNTHLLLVGDGPLRPALAAQASLNPKVRFLGQRLDLERIYPALDLICLASVREGLPLSLLEAMAYGVPAVATAVGGVPALLAQGGGVTVDVGDDAALAQALDALLGAPERRGALGLEARALVAARYSEAAMVARYVDLYRELACAKR